MIFKRLLRTAKTVFLICILAGCGSAPPRSSHAATSTCVMEKDVERKNQAPDTNEQRRPFYIIGHNPNTPADAIRQLRMGFNALGPDIRYVDGQLRVGNQFMLGNIAIGWPS
jgi:hypothetical protein